MNLTAKQSLFVREYLVDLNATKAAIRAGYSQKTAEQIGHQLLQKTSVSAAVEKAMEKRSAKTELTADWVLEKLRIIIDACSNPEKGFNPAGANKALELIGRHRGMFTDKLDLTSKGLGFALDYTLLSNAEKLKLHALMKKAQRE